MFHPKKNSEDPGVPSVRKAARPIDQIDKTTGKIIASFPSYEAAGRAIGCSGTAVGISVRTKSVCQGFIFRFSGFTQDDMCTEQPVIKICCNDGSRTHFKTMAEAAKDAGISTPGLRNRILTKLHREGFHWIFDKSTHYNGDTREHNTPERPPESAEASS